MTNSTSRSDLYSKVTADIVRHLEAGVRPWHQPWTNQKHAAGGISRPLRFNGQPYHGINVVILWLTAFEKGFSAPLWLTFNQAHELGGYVKKGEKSATVVYANTFEKSETDAATGEEITAKIPYLKSYCVFNVDQTEGLPAHYYARIEGPKTAAERHAQAEAFFTNTGFDVRYGGDRAYYRSSGDHIQLPPFEAFESGEKFYATLAHESVHATKHERRLNRNFDSKRFGDEGYSLEELVAEMGAAFLCVDLGITPEVMPDHASYLDSWLRVLKADVKAVFTAAAHAERAADYLHRLQPGPINETPDTN